MSKARSVLMFVSGAVCAVGFLITCGGGGMKPGPGGPVGAQPATSYEYATAKNGTEGGIYRLYSGLGTYTAIDASPCKADSGFDGLGPDDATVCLMNLLAAQGWEPFLVTRASTGSSTEVFYRRVKR